MDYEKLTDNEINALIVERLMGWSNVDLYPTLGSTEAYWSGIDPAVNDHRPIPRYSADDNAARKVRNRIAELNLRVSYAEHLGKMLEAPNGTQHKHFVSRFTFQQATPRQQCVAALKAFDAAQQTPEAGGTAE